MANTAQDRLAVLDHLITQAEERRIQKMLYIAELRADGQNSVEAEDELQRIEELLTVMKARRLSQPSQEKTS